MKVTFALVKQSACVCGDTRNVEIFLYFIHASSHHQPVCTQHLQSDKFVLNRSARLLTRSASAKSPAKSIVVKQLLELNTRLTRFILIKFLFHTSIHIHPHIHPRAYPKYPSMQGRCPDRPESMGWQRAQSSLRARRASANEKPVQDCR